MAQQTGKKDIRTVEELEKWESGIAWIQVNQANQYANRIEQHHTFVLTRDNINFTCGKSKALQIRLCISGRDYGFGKEDQHIVLELKKDAAARLFEVLRERLDWEQRWSKESS